VPWQYHALARGQVEEKTISGSFNFPLFIGILRIFGTLAPSRSKGSSLLVSFHFAFEETWNEILSPHPQNDKSHHLPQK
jgi:hypothetical protein